MRPIFVGAPEIPADSAFNTERAFQRLVTILGDEAPHPVDSDANDLVRQRLLAQITSLGFEPIVRDEFHCSAHKSGVTSCARVQNVAFWVTPPGPNAVLVMSHYDSVPAGPGAADDGIGVASSLEIAAILKSRELSRPLLVLITDGEEAGLIGASAFVANDPLAERVAAVVNMEARGVKGPALLIQTSRPNGRDLKALEGRGVRPMASSLNADIYDLLPNDTDMTEFLGLDIDAANYAISNGAHFYHTPRDNLANLDKRSLAHMGMNGLAAVEAFLAQTGSEPEGERLYADIFSRFVISTPVMSGAAFMLFGGVMAGALVYVKREDGAIIRAVAAPLIALVLGLALAISATWLVGVIRPERFFGGTHPWALRGVHGAAAMLGGFLVYGYFVRATSRTLLLASAWVWFAILGLVLFVFVPGAAIIFAPSLIIFGIAAFLALLKRPAASGILAIIATLAFAIIALPLAQLGEIGLFIEGAAPFAIVAGLLFVFAAPFTLNEDAQMWPQRQQITLVAAGIFAAFTIASLLVPAHSHTAPRGLSVRHVQDAGSGAAHWIFSGRETPPKAMRDMAGEVTLGEHPVLGERQLAPAPRFASAGLSVVIVADGITDEERNITIDMSAPDADRMWISLEGEPVVTALLFKGEVIEATDTPLHFINCTGRSCASSTLTLYFDADTPAPELMVMAQRYGLGPESEPLLAARPDWAVAQHSGDQRGVYTVLALDPEDEEE
ncbi:MAG: M20/M25/M40 family metallo-hydrolase [Henriciella sp.]|nr:M20/M25/M40 family metallo-hydrolase [Henriciella sp.]